jgi:hypothetical protein
VKLDSTRRVLLSGNDKAGFLPLDLLLQTFQSGHSFLKRLLADFEALCRCTYGGDLRCVCFDHSIHRPIQNSPAKKPGYVLRCCASCRTITSPSTTLIQAWASHKSFRKKNGSDDDGSNFHGQKRKNDTHESATDPDARLNNALKRGGDDFHFSFGKGTDNPAQGEAEMPESLTWLCRDCDPAKTAQNYEQDAAEKSKPVFRVGVVNR